MSVISFKTPTKTDKPKPETQAVATVPKQEVATRWNSPQIEGEFTAKDIAVPYLTLGQKSSKEADDNPELIGKFLYDKQINLGNSIRAVICRLGKRYEENLPYGSEDIPRRYDKIEEAKAEGVDVRDVADIDLLIETDDAELAEFGQFDCEGKSYLPARYTVRSSSYGATVKFILKDLGGWLKGDLSSGYYAMSTEKRTGPKGSWFVPKLKADGKVSEELRKMIAERFGN